MFDGHDQFWLSLALGGYGPQTHTHKDNIQYAYHIDEHNQHDHDPE